MTPALISVAALVLGCSTGPAGQQSATAPVAMTAPDAVIDLLERLEQAQRTIREGVHSRYSWCDLGRWEGSVVKPPRTRLRMCAATRRLLWKISTVRALSRTSTSCCVSA